MAETRTYDPTEPEGIQKLVREALGESIRPVEPGAPQFPARADERVATTLSASDLPLPTGLDQLWVPPGT